MFRSAGLEQARALLRQSGYHNEPVVVLHAASSAVLNPIGLVVADQLRQAGFNVDLHTSDFATVAQRRQSRAPVEQGGWSVVPIIWNGIDLVNPLSDPAVSNNCNEFNPGMVLRSGTNRIAAPLFRGGDGCGTQPARG